jgi:hypothetical protein
MPDSRSRARRFAASLLCTICSLLLHGSPLQAQTPPEVDDHAHMHDHQHDPGHAAHEAATPVLCGVCPAGRESEGTSWQPDDAADHQQHGGWTIHDWQVMAHLQATVIDTHEGGPRGDDMWFSTNFFMVNASRRVGRDKKGVFGMQSMWSLEPAMGSRGYPLLLQTGETSDVETPLIDRQHPHDFPMELAVTYSRKIDADRAFYVYVAAVGAPALGPPAFMHRPSSASLPIAPITHHWFDATHVTFGVVTAGFVPSPTFKIEGSAFRGREPDYQRWNFEAPKLDSYSARLSINPQRHLSFQVSGGSLHSPESLHPQADVVRVTASAMYSQRWEHLSIDALLGWGRNKRTEVKRPVPGGFFFIPGNLSQAALAETTVRLWTRHAVIARVEHANKDELFGLADSRHFTTYPVSRVTTGYVFDLVRTRHLTVGAGAAASWSHVGAEIQDLYGGSPRSGLGFLQIAVH